MRVLKIMIEDNPLHKAVDFDMPTDSDANDSDAPDSNRPSLILERASMASQRTPPLRETVRASLLPHAPVPGQRALSNTRLSADSRRSSMEIRRRSYDSRHSSDGRRSISLSRHPDRSPISPVPQGSFGAPITVSMDRETESSAAIQSLDETNASASQILNRSDVFQAPTLHPPQRSGSVDRLQRVSQDTARSTRMSQTPRTSTDQGRHKLQKQRPSPTPISTIQPTVSEQDMNRPTAGSSYSFQNLVRAGTSPLQSAGALGNFLKTRSKRMSTLLASESMGYLEKVSGMWAGGGRHYGSPLLDGMPADDDDEPNEDEEKRDAVHAQRFREHFALPDSEQLHATWYCFLHRVLPLYGKIYLGSTFLCFRPLLPGVKLKVFSRGNPSHFYSHTDDPIKLKLPLIDIENVSKEKGYRLGYSGIVVVIKGHEEIFFDFSDQGHRDDCNISLLLTTEATKKRRLKESDFLNEEEVIAAEAAKAEHKALQAARKSGHAVGDHEVDLPQNLSYIGMDPILSLLDIADMLEASETRGIFVDDPKADLAKSPKPMVITCLTIGSRGDVQPYIALAKGLMKDGHKVRIATHTEFGPWVESHGIEFAPVAGDPAELMRICVEHGMFTLSFMREATTHVKTVFTNCVHRMH